MGNLLPGYDVIGDERLPPGVSRNLRWVLQRGDPAAWSVLETEGGSDKGVYAYLICEDLDGDDWVVSFFANDENRTITILEFERE